MAVSLALRNDSARKRVIRRDRLERLANRVCDGENISVDVEISALLCDDAAIAELNRNYGDGSGPTDVLSFEQERRPAAHPWVLGDIVISIETAARNCRGNVFALRREVEMLFCHGLLHLLGYDHHTSHDRARMQRKQAEYLGLAASDAWNFGPKTGLGRPASTAEGIRRVGQ
jgi:probable rRNA maturation factor